MGIDIYLGGYTGYQSRTTHERAAFDKAVQRRNKCKQGSAAYKKAQVAVEAAADAMWAGKVGYLRSSYNPSGLFNVLDKLFGTDSAALLLPGDWDEQSERGKDADGEAEHGIEVKWSEFNAAVAQMRAAAACLKHGDPLPVAFEELQAQPSEARMRGEAFGKSVLGMFTQVIEAQGGSVETGNHDQHGFYNEDDYGWYVREGLQDLEDFGKLGAELQARGEPCYVYISH
jgi:hypothetical protein